jgi:hypothetical protein
MAQKWTDEQKAKFKETMTRIYAEKRARKEQAMEKLAKRKAEYRAKAKKRLRYKGNGLEQRKTDVVLPHNLPVIEISNGVSRDVQEFAEFMAAAWRVYKGL